VAKLGTALRFPESPLTVRVQSVRRLFRKIEFADALFRPQMVSSPHDFR